MKSLCFGVFLLFVLVGQVKAGQDGTRYTLDSVLQTASRQNYDLASVQAEMDAMRADYRKSLSLFLPQLSVSEIYTRTNDPLNVFGLKLKQEIVTQADFNPVTLNQPKAVDNYTTKLEWRQPLLNMDGFFGFRAASSGVKAMEEKSKRTSYYITYQAKIAYYQLIVALQSREVIRKALTAAQTGNEQARNFFEQGLIRRSDILFAELRLKELEAKQLETENMIDNANNQL
ncbi:MAG TPA: TolC family protein, partial [bacterium]|nr:TolC family protein [bacterium]